MFYARQSRERAKATIYWTGIKEAGTGAGEGGEGRVRPLSKQLASIIAAGRRGSYPSGVAGQGAVSYVVDRGILIEDRYA